MPYQDVQTADRRPAFPQIEGELLRSLDDTAEAMSKPAQRESADKPFFSLRWLT